MYRVVENIKINYMQKYIEKLKSYNLTRTTFVGLFLGIFLAYFSLSWLGSILHRILIFGLGDITTLVGVLFLFLLSFNSEFRNYFIKLVKDQLKEDKNVE